MMYAKSFQLEIQAEVEGKKTWRPLPRLGYLEASELYLQPLRRMVD